MGSYPQAASSAVQMLFAPGAALPVTRETRAGDRAHTAANLPVLKADAVRAGRTSRQRAGLPRQECEAYLADMRNNYGFHADPTGRGGDRAANLGHGVAPEDVREQLLECLGDATRPGVTNGAYTPFKLRPAVPLAIADV